MIVKKFEFFLGFNILFLTLIIIVKDVLRKDLRAIPFGAPRPCLRVI